MAAIAVPCDEGEPEKASRKVPGAPAFWARLTLSAGGSLGFAIAVSLVAHTGALVVPYAARTDRLEPPVPLVLTIAPPRQEPALVPPVEPRPSPPRRDDRPRPAPVAGGPVPAAPAAPAPPIPAQLAEPLPERNEAPVTSARTEPPAAATARLTAPATAAASEGALASPRPDPGAPGGPAAATVAALATPPRESPRPGSNGAADRIEPPHYGPAYLENPEPRYPAAARRMRLEGTVLVRVRVSAAGLPEEVTLAASSGTPILDDAAISAIRSWRFIPARRGETPITHWAEVPVRFRLQE